MIEFIESGKVLIKVNFQGKLSRDCKKMTKLGEIKEHSPIKSSLSEFLSFILSYIHFSEFFI